MSKDVNEYIFIEFISTTKKKTSKYSYHKEKLHKCGFQRGKDTNHRKQRA